MKILIFTDYYFPGVNGGGPVTSISNLANFLCKYADITIVTRNIDIGEDKPYTDEEIDKFRETVDYNVRYLKSVNLYSLFLLIKDEKPDIVYLNSFFSMFSFLFLLLSIFFNKSKIILSPRGELLENALKIKALKKKMYLPFARLIFSFESVKFIASDVTELSEIKSVLGSVSVVELPNIPKIYDCQVNYIKHDPIKLVFVARILRNKNLHLALNALSKVKCNCSLDIYGPIEDVDYWRYCKSLISELGENVIVTYKGKLESNRVMAELINFDALLYPTETENFGHVIVESMLCGLVPIISSNTPWKNLEEIGVGWDHLPDDVNLFSKAITALSNMSDADYKYKVELGQDYINNKLDRKFVESSYKKLFIG